MLGSRESIIRNKRKKAWLFPFASNYSSVIREFSNGLWKLLEGSWKHNHRPSCGDLQVRNRISTMTHNLTALSEISGYIILLNLKIITTVLFFRFLELNELQYWILFLMQYLVTLLSGSFQNLNPSWNLSESCQPWKSVVQQWWWWWRRWWWWRWWIMIFNSEFRDLGI